MDKILEFIDQTTRFISSLKSSNLIPRDVETAFRERLNIGAGAFPIGAIYTSVTGVNPSIELGYGTWSAFASGQVIVGVDTGQTEFNTVLKTGGEKTHTLTISEMPAHNHSTDGVNHTPAGFGGSASSGSTQVFAAETMQNAGGGNAHNNLQPYITAYFWRRTA